MHSEATQCPYGRRPGAGKPQHDGTRQTELIRKLIKAIRGFFVVWYKPKKVDILFILWIVICKES